MRRLGLPLAALVACADHKLDPLDPLDSGAPTSPQVALPDHVIVIVLDGVRPEESLGWGETILGSPTEAVLAETRAALLPVGALLTGAAVGGETYTEPAHATMLTGRRTPMAGWPLDHGPGPVRPDVPTLFEAAGLDAAEGLLVGNTAFLSSFAHSLSPGMDEVASVRVQVMAEATGRDGLPADTLVVERLLRELAEGELRLALANLHQGDIDAHRGDVLGHLDGLAAVDPRLVDLWERVEAHPELAGRTLLVVTADHGRHEPLDPAEDPVAAWHDHGDACEGCRRVPLLLVGPGVRGGLVDEGPVLPEDISATIAALLDFDLPYGQGRPLTQAFEVPLPDREVAGEVRPAAAGAHLAVQRWRIGKPQRAEIVVDDEVVSHDGAWLAEAPALAGDDGRLVACWRQLSVAPEGGLWPWRLVCVEGAEGGWEPLPPPVDEVGSHGGYALGQDERERTWLLAARVPQTGKGSDEDPHFLAIDRRTEGAWEERGEAVWQHAQGEIWDPALLAVGEQAWVAIVVEESGEDPVLQSRRRYTRHLEVLRVDWPAGQLPSWSRALHTDTDRSAWREAYPGTSGVDMPFIRMEHPALGRFDGQLRVAVMGWDEALDASFAVFTSEDGARWEGPALLGADTRPLPHLAPVWTAGGALAWAALDEAGRVEICRGDHHVGTLGCAPTGADAIDGLVLHDGALLAALRSGGLPWNLQLVEP